MQKEMYDLHNEETFNGYFTVQLVSQKVLKFDIKP